MARWWAQVVGALHVHPDERWFDHPRKSDRRNSGICALFWPLLMQVPMAGTLRRSRDVAEMLRKCHRVSRLVGAVVGAVGDQGRKGKSACAGRRIRPTEDVC